MGGGGSSQKELPIDVGQRIRIGMKDPSDIRDLLRKLLQAGLTQRDIATRIGTTQATVSRWVNGSDPRGSHRDSIRALAGQVGIVPGMTAMVTGYIDQKDGIRYFPYSETGRRVQIPYSAEGKTALEIRGPVFGFPLVGWFIYYQDRRPRLQPEHLGALCILGVDGDVHLGVPRAGSRPGSYDLTLLSGQLVTNIVPEELRSCWAAFVTAIAPEIAPEYTKPPML